MEKIIRRVLQEILDPKNILNPEHQLPVRSAGTSPAGKGIKKDLFVFRTKKYKYIVELEHFPDDIIAVAYKPKVGRDYGGKEGKNIYSFQTNDPERLKVLNTVFSKVHEICQDNPKVSVIFFGSPDTDEVNDNDERFDNSKRFRIYMEGVRRLFHDVDYVRIKDESKSAVAVISRVKLKEDPQIKEKAIAVLKKHF